MSIWVGAEGKAEGKGQGHRRGLDRPPGQADFGDWRGFFGHRGKREIKNQNARSRITEQIPKRGDSIDQGFGLESAIDLLEGFSACRGGWVMV